MYKSRRKIQISRCETDFIALSVIFVSAPVVSVGLMGGFVAVAVVLIAVPVTPVVVPVAAVAAGGRTHHCDAPKPRRPSGRRGFGVECPLGVRCVF